MEFKLEQKDAADWVYRGEGAANLVLAYTGSSPLFIGKVMRIPKRERNGPSYCGEKENLKEVLTEEERLIWSEPEELVSCATEEQVQLLYVKHVMSPLLGPKHVDAGTHLQVSREFIEIIEKKVSSQRPSWRVDASKIDTHLDSVLLMSDHSLFSHGIDTVRPCVSVEIKPKCGFLPISTFIADRNSIKKSTTRFKMHQILKLRQCETSEVSQYDPLDIFSGSKERIQKAIRALYATPQNNFRVFMNGSLIFGGLGGGTQKTSIVIEKAFEDALKGAIQAKDGLCTTSLIELVAKAVYSSKVLDRLLEVQKLDSLDIEGAIHAYYNIISQPCMVCRELAEAGLSHKYASLHSISMNESLKIVRDYLIAATAKDCSLMISFRPREEGDFGSPYSNIFLQSTNQNFDYKVNFLDLDLKPLKKMETYYEKDKKILNSYIQMLKTMYLEGNKTMEKTIVSVELLCSKCRQKVMKLISDIEGITSIVLDPSKNTVTVIGEADPVKIIRKVRKFRKSATIVSIGPPKEEKKDDKDKIKDFYKDGIVVPYAVPYAPKTCQRCDVWYVVGDDFYSSCSIM
ncbi:inositol-pentakisphosphate 2-kinase isoform X2 [Mercurialis annua]|uniref:inositol-pentakisphosphate 2-kinase isoform X2 n=1 Tax=Mercurialis annua TaxID=3986 RepID=UPI0024AF56AF|nr:inositol-pentakisphosphate 2-kinase isoform X2 [Mercurialis annua]